MDEVLPGDAEVPGSARHEDHGETGDQQVSTTDGQCTQTGRETGRF
jgi:hypothetical protein